jgi:hypothetical protein
MPPTATPAHDAPAYEVLTALHCPECGAPLLRWCDYVWCSREGSPSKPGCDYGVFEPVHIDQHLAHKKKEAEMNEKQITYERVPDGTYTNGEDMTIVHGDTLAVARKMRNMKIYVGKLPKGFVLMREVVRAARPIVVCLCGSTRFGNAFAQANLEETLAGKIVLTIGCNLRSDAELFADMSMPALQELKARLDELHLRKIDMADEVLILNVGGYIGESTSRELAYAIKTGKRVRYLELTTP